ncbi:MAG TPA: penicillin acylase family protein [Beijerinckiaceae bacterium]|nr:penicillin acylase family protein [Beijerinckiaceae bacterium]
MAPSIPEERIALAGLKAPAEIAIDRWGIPHLRAQSLDDLFCVQGFNAARDRLFQLDLWRKRGLGLLAGDFGPGYLEQDRASRTFLYRGDMTAEYARYGDDTQAICEAFVRGVNAFIALAERRPEHMPDEFALLGTKPARWAAEDVLRIRTHALSQNALSEIARAVILSRADAATDALRKTIEPPVALDPKLDLSAIPASAADLFKLATAGVTLSRERLQATLAEAGRWSIVNDLGEVQLREHTDGSNNWAIHGSRTASGRPILGSDPHRAHSVPSLRYLVHLTAPGFDAIGAGEPALPGISLGHNGTIAFGLTIFGADLEDVFVYETHPDDADAYRYGAGFERMRIVEERVPVKGHADQKVRMKFTRHGPVVHEDPSRRLAIAIRSVWQEPGSAAYAASLATMRARDYESFRSALRRWGAPSVNMVYADVEGNIAWMPAGFNPKRTNWNGLTPVPGDGSHEWDGMVDPDALPRVRNPDRGFVYSANEMNLPADWPHDQIRVGHEWIEASRANRIREVLSGTESHTLGHTTALQTDVTSLPARRLLALLRQVSARTAEEAAALAMFTGWDCGLEADSAPAALFEVWFARHLKPALFALLVPDAGVRALLMPGDVEGILRALERPDRRFGESPESGRNALLLSSLAAAYADCAARMGKDTAQWQWGRLHHGYFEHVVSRLLPESGRGRFDVGPLPKGGSASTPMHTGYRPSDFRILHGASVRLAIDVGGWDNSLCLNAPGQSGDPKSPHYRDLAPLWAGGRYVPLLYSRSEVDKATIRRIVLEPG